MKFAVFDSGMEVDRLARLALERDIENALDKGEFEVVYQPQVLIENAEIIGAEALVRWRHPVRGYVSPVAFIPVADAPVLYALEPRTDGTLVGAGTDGFVWAQDKNGTWQQLEPLVGAVQALNTIDDRIILVDDRGVVEITADGSTILSPTR